MFTKKCFNKLNFVSIYPVDKKLLLASIAKTLKSICLRQGFPKGGDFSSLGGGL